MSQQLFTERFEKLTDRQQEVLLLVLAGEEDRAIAQTLHIRETTVRKHIEKICKTFRLIPRPGDRSKRPELIELFQQYRPDLVKMRDIPNQVKVTETPIEESSQDSCSIQKSFRTDFVGREGAIAQLNTLVRQGAKIIVIQAAGGVGKTTLAGEYLKTQGFDLVLELMMAKEKENITAIESVVEEWLKQDLKEEPGREFGVMLGRLKRQLQNRRVGVLIDNLEPALDKQGKFIELHRRYVELLRVLADSTVQSVTLITSRERLCESSLNVESYRLEGLDEQAWHQFFSSRSANIDVLILSEMHKAYGGNAKAMGILCGAIREDFAGDMAAYWRENGCDLLVKRDLEDLVTSQFNRLQQIDPEAYKLLCRLGCYRYQDVLTVLTEGLLCLLWDVEARRRRIIESLQNRSLVEFQKGEYWLHPMIRAEAIKRLRESEDWETANRKAAEFWTESVETVKSVEDALKAFEAYYHYVEIKDFEQAGGVIIKPRPNQWQDRENGEALGKSFSRLDLLQKITKSTDDIMAKISSDYIKSHLNNILGNCYWLTGDLHQAIELYNLSRGQAAKFLKVSQCNEQIRSMRYTELDCLGMICFCNADLGELGQAIKIAEEATQVRGLPRFYRYIVQPAFWLAFSKQYFNFTKKACFVIVKRMQQEFKKRKLPLLYKAYSIIYLALVYKNLGEIEKSFETYYEAMLFAEDSNYLGLRAVALNGLAELDREKEDFSSALKNHSAAIELLDKLGAKCRLAESYYQLALTYQKMSDTEKSQDNFYKAIRLFSEMEAPKQVEKVRRAMENGGEQR